MSSWIEYKGDQKARTDGVLVVNQKEGVENRVGDDGVCAILQYRPSDLYLMDRKETMAILQKDTHTPLHVCK